MEFNLLSFDSLCFSLLHVMMPVYELFGELFGNRLPAHVHSIVTNVKQHARKISSLALIQSE